MTKSIMNTSIHNISNENFQNLDQEIFQNTQLFKKINNMNNKKNRIDLDKFKHFYSNNVSPVANERVTFDMNNNPIRSYVPSPMGLVDLQEQDHFPK